MAAMDTPEQTNVTTSTSDTARRALDLLRSHSLTTIVLQELERLILAGELEPGQRINEKAFAERHGLSRGPIREACRRLEQAGLVRIVVNRGVFVRELDPGDAAELSDIRAVLSGLAGRLLAARIGDSDLDRLSEMVVRMETLAAAGDVDAYYPLNVAFHDRMFALIGNRRLAEMLAAIDKELYLARRKSLNPGSHLRRSVEEHRQILAALRARDVDAAAAIFRRHAMSGKSRLLGLMGVEEGESVGDG
jgi:DNA-binding GntR family transcriptional regulator